MTLRNALRLLPFFLRCLFRLPFKNLVYIARMLRYEKPQAFNDRLYISTFFPSIPSKGFNLFMDNVLAYRRIPYSTYIALTSECPCSCDFCSLGGRISGSLDPTEVSRIIRDVQALGSPTIGLTGGEPLLDREIVSHVGEISEKCNSVIFTTGHGLDRELAAGLKAAGLGGIMIGLESSSAGEHDRIKHLDGSFNTAMQALELSRKAGIYTALSAVADRQKLRSGELKKMLELAAEMKVNEFRILEPVATGCWHKKNNVFLTKEESEEISELHRSWNRGGRLPVICSFSWLESEKMFGCGAGYFHLFIDHHGNTCPCDLTPLSFGNVLERPLKQIWQDMEMYFSRPRTECFMKTICGEMKEMDTESLPLSPEQSAALCGKYPMGKMPRIFENYLGGKS